MAILARTFLRIPSASKRRWNNSKGLKNSCLKARPESGLDGLVCAGFRVSSFRFRVSGFGCRVSGFGLRVEG